MDLYRLGVVKRIAKRSNISFETALQEQIEIAERKIELNAYGDVTTNEIRNALDELRVIEWAT